MAIRRVKDRDRVYFYDFFHAVMAVDSEEYEFDITQLAFPIHGIIQEIPRLMTDFVEKLESRLPTNSRNVNKIELVKMEGDIILKEQIRNLKCLYHLCVAANMLNQLTSPLNNHILFPIVESTTELHDQFSLNNQGHLKPYYTTMFTFSQKMFELIINEESFLDQCSQTLKKRNKLFTEKELLNQTFQRLKQHTSKQTSLVYLHDA